MAIGGFVQHEIRLLRALGREAQVVEQVFAKAGALDGFQELLRDDRIGIDIDHVERCGGAGELVEFLHFNFLR